jgi:L-lactate dehydrogenase complex protein LldE
MRIGLFIPCYIDQFYPHVGIATLKLLEKIGYEVIYPRNQTCCGQPMANAGLSRYSHGAGELFYKNFRNFDYIVCPSGSCALHIKEHADEKVKSALHHKIFELCEFLIDVAHVHDTGASFPHKVTLHASCHGLRGLRTGSASELHEPFFSKPKSLLQKVKGIELLEPSRKDECCGFGGTFAVSEEAVSVRMGNDCLTDHALTGAGIITGTDISCLMHLEGLLRRQKKNMRVMHIAEILNAEE